MGRAASLFADISTSGHEVEYGVMVGATYKFAQHWLASAEAGWMQTKATLTGDGLTLDMKQSGPAFFLGVIWRLNGEPPKVE